MEILLPLLAITFLLWLLFAPIAAFMKAADAQREARHSADQLQAALMKLKQLEKELQQLREERLMEPTVGKPPVADAAPIVTETAPLTVDTQDAALESVLERLRLEEARISAAEKHAPPPLPVVRVPLVPLWTQEEDDRTAADVPTPPPMKPEEPFSLERFMGVKLFAWLGGLAMFFGVSFFVKYAFDNNLIPPSMRITLGFVTGAGLLTGGLFCHRLPRYRVLAQAFCATGVLVLYGVSFAAHAIYHFPAFGMVTTFLLMAVVTFAAFLIAVRLDALVVAVLGMLGGFLTPVLLTTGQDQVFGLFSYIALLDVGLLAVSRHGRWRPLTSGAAVGTGLMLIGWNLQFFITGHYAEGSKILIPMGILAGFCGLFLAGGWLGRSKPDEHAAASVLGLSAVATAFAFTMLGFQLVAERPLLLYGFILIIHGIIIAAVVKQPRLGLAQVIAALAAFVHLAFWTQHQLTNANLPAALVIYLIFGALHAVLPVFLMRRFGSEPATVPLKAGPWMGPAILLLMLLPIVNLPAVPMLIWAGVLLADLLVIALAIVTGAILPLIATLVLTMGLAGVWLSEVPANGESLMPFLLVVAGFSAVFAAAGKWLSRHRTAENGGPLSMPSLLPIGSGLLPFILLVFAVLRLPVENPSPVYVTALALAALLAWLAIGGKQGPLALAALGGTLVLEAVWHSARFRPEDPAIALAWNLGFYLAFLALPFVFRKACAGSPSLWIASALSGVGHFLLVHDAVKRAFPNDMMGLVPAAFAVPALAGLWVLLRWFPEMDKLQRSRLAWFGGVALLFVTLIFPIQLERQWITVSWAIEGAMLLWLFRRVPHPGLQFAALGLLAISFLRLTVNSAVFTVYPRSGTDLFNWYLYTYGTVAAAQFMAAGWLSNPDLRFAKFHPRAALNCMGGVLLFALLNIEIADFFTAPDQSFPDFGSSGNFARDMTYSIAWGLFSLGLLGLGFRLASRHARFAAVALLAITLLKVFLHDLAAIENIFRIGALIGVAVIAFIASFLYQRFFDRPKAPTGVDPR